MTTTNTINKQLELGFNHSLSAKFAPRHGRIARANWWFTQMREAVAGAIDWSTAEPRPEQIWMPGVHRQVKV
jgi:hypothetical protein